VLVSAGSERSRSGSHLETRSDEETRWQARHGSAGSARGDACPSRRLITYPGSCCRRHTDLLLDPIPAWKGSEGMGRGVVSCPASCCPARMRASGPGAARLESLDPPGEEQRQSILSRKED